MRLNKRPFDKNQVAMDDRLEITGLSGLLFSSRKQNLDEKTYWTIRDTDFFLGREAPAKNASKAIREPIGRRLQIILLEKGEQLRFTTDNVDS